MASRRKSRERALQILFLCDQREQTPEEAIASYAFTLHSEDDDFSEMSRDKFMEELVRGTMQNRESLDKHITGASEHWRLERMPAVDRNILRLATFELLDGKLPHAVIIDEALELARRFSGNESVGFVNGVLDSIRAATGHLRPADAAAASGKKGGKKQPGKAIAAGSALPHSPLLSDAERAEDAIENVVGSGGASDAIERPERGIKIEQ